MKKTLGFIKKSPPKTAPEKKLSAKYKKLLEATNDFNELQNLAREFKADLSVFLQRNRRYSFMIVLLLFTSISFSQTAPKYTYYVKWNKLLTTTKVDTSLYKKTNYYEIKVKGEFKNNSDAIANGLKVGDLYSLPLNDGISLIAIVKLKEVETQGTITNIVSYLSREK